MNIWKNGKQETIEGEAFVEVESSNEPTLEEQIQTLKKEKDILENALLELSLFIYGGADNG